jgi:peptide-methionine (S)-S-oxide reductase
MSASSEIATLGGGCFWCTEAVFDQLDGVTDVVSGYSGGHVDMVQVRFDPAKVSFREILEVFFSSHDPTTPNRQGNDVGPQYRSAIFTHSDEQGRVAQELIAELNESGAWPNRIVTEVTPFTNFYAAEDYHQEYFANNGGQPYCQFVVAPKVAKFRKQYGARLKA